MDDKQVQTRAIVLHTTNFGEADRFVLLLSPTLGIFEAKARGSRRGRSALLLPTEFLSLADFQLFHYKDSYTVNSADLLYSFRKIKEDIIRLTCASHLSELLRDLSMQREAAQDLYELMARAFTALEGEQPEPLQVVHACEIRLMRMSGYGLSLNQCAICGAELDEGPGVFSFEQMGLLCPAHRQQLSQPDRHAAAAWQRPSWQELSAGTLAALDWFAHSSLPQLFAFATNPDINRELASFTRDYLSWNLDKNYSKLDMLGKF